MTEIAVLIYEHVLPSATAAIIEALSIANFHWGLAHGESAPPFSFRTLSFDGNPVRAMGGISLAPDGSSEQLGRPDLIFVPAIRCDNLSVLDKSLATLSAQWGGALRAHHERQGYIAANCSAAHLLAEAGLLDGRKATTSWFLARRFRKRYPRVQLQPELLVTKDCRIFCAAAFSACLNLCVEIIAEFIGPSAALALARVMLVDFNRMAQLPYANILNQIKPSDDLVLRAQTLLIADFANTPDLEKLAKQLHVTSRTLTRRFKKAIGETPHTFLQNARIERAKRLLETTDLTFDQIVYRVGYEDVSSFRRLFARASGVSPRDYRRRFGVRGH